MKTLIRTSLLSALLCTMAVSGFAQTLLLWDDPSAILSPKGSQQLETKLLGNDIQMMMTMEFSKRCDYLYGELNNSMNKAVLNIYDCNRKTLGTKTWMSKFFTLSEEEKVALISFAVVEIIENSSVSAPSEHVKPDHSAPREYSIPFNHHTTRHFFTPTSFNLSRGELYYSTLLFGTHDLQYGITDKFSVGMGTTIIFNPFYITPKYSFTVGEKNTFSIGSLLMIGTWTTSLFGNLGYATYTRGDQFNNITFGLGHVYLEESSDVYANTIIGNVAGIARVSDYLYFVSENYLFSVSSNHTAMKYDDDFGNLLFSENFSLQNTYVAGMTGFRFVNKDKNVSAFQFGLGYIFRFRESIPSKYIDPDVYIQDLSDWKRFIIPTIGFVHKLGKRV